MVREENNAVLTTEVHVNIVTSTTSSDLISNEVRDIFQWVFYAVASQIFGIFGTIANIINIICFVKQGFKDGVNISLLALAISDLGGLVTLMWTNLCYTPAFNELDLPFEPIEFQYLTGAFPHVTFTRVTSWITAFITLERCLCVAIPLKVKTVFTRKRVTAIIVCIFMVLILNISPLYYVNSLAASYSLKRNKTLIGLVFTGNQPEVESVTVAISNVHLSAFVVIVVCTITVVVKLRIKSKWRQASTGPGQSESASSRDQKVTKMVIMISVLFIACFIPVGLVTIFMYVEPQLSITGKYRNLFIAVCSIGFVLESTNSAMNIFIYYHMSSKYRTVCRQLLSLRG